MQNIITDSKPLDHIKLPHSFIKNNGQEDSRALFTTAFKDRRFFFSSDRITSVELEPIEEHLPEPEDFPVPFHESGSETLRNGVAVELSFVNAKSDLIPEGVLPQPGYHHFYKGNDSTKWSKCVPHYKELCYPAVWEGVDLEVSDSQDGMKMNWVLDRPDRASSIRLHWAGADSLEIDDTGNLLVHHALGTLTDLCPIAYQEIDGEREPVGCAYRLFGNYELGFELTGSYLENIPLIIDPILTYTTYLGGNLTDEARGIAVDTEGCAYVTGTTASVDFPVTPGAFQTTAGGGGDAFVAKFASNGGSLIYSTYLGGSGGDVANAISLDTQDCAYVTGSTLDDNFPVTPGAFQTTKLFVLVTGFITKFSTDGGSLIYSTYLGGTRQDIMNGIVVDAQGYAYITGWTSSPDFPVTPGVFQTNFFAGTAFVTKLALDGSSLIYSTFLSGRISTYGQHISVDSLGNAYITGFVLGNLGGSLTDQCRGIAVDTQGCAHVVGDTTSIDFPVTPGAFQTTNAGVSNVFVTKFSSDGSSLIYSTYLGGSGTDLGYAIALDAQDCSYVTGQTASANFPITPGAFQTTAGGIFVTKLAVDGDSLIYSTFLGSGGTGFGIAVDSQGCSYVTGQGGTIPTTPGAFQTTLTAPVGSVGFITKFSDDGSDLIYSTYLYGNGNGYCQGIALDAYDYAYVTGITNASNFPVTPGAFQTTLTSNAVTVTKLAIDGSSLAYSTFLSGSSSDVARNITVDSQGCAYVTGRTASADFPVTPNAFQTTYGGGSDDVFLTKLSPGGNSLIGSTFLGGDLHDDGFGVALDEYGHAYVTGHTQSSNFPITPNVISSALEGASDAFISIFSSDLTNLIVSYYLGGSGGETGWGIALGPEGEVYTAGVTSSPNFPVTSGAYQTTLNGISDAYVTRTGIAFYRQVSVDIIGY
ncbi:MAG: SBBP repeat-containing protein [Clostridiales bacterium]|nr:SBBP repeat-containing protein [Clostridiales bacterium]